VSRSAVCASRWSRKTAPLSSDGVKAAGIRRVVMPLSGQAAADAQAAAERGVEVSFHNQSVTSPLASTLLLAIKAGGASRASPSVPPTLPRLASRRSCGATDSDSAGLWINWTLRTSRAAVTSRRWPAGTGDQGDGIHPALASFGGWFVLGAANSSVEPLRRTAERFGDLLAQM